MQCRVKSSLLGERVTNHRTTTPATGVRTTVGTPRCPPPLKGGREGTRNPTFQGPHDEETLNNEDKHRGEEEPGTTDNG